MNFMRLSLNESRTRGYVPACRGTGAVIGLRPTYGYEKCPCVQQPLFMEASPSPLSSRPKRRDLQFRGPLLEKFFDTVLMACGPPTIMKNAPVSSNRSSWKLRPSLCHLDRSEA